MLNELISILIPIKNVEKTIEKCLETLISQSYKNFIIYVLYENSEDETWEIIKKIQNKYPEKIIIKKTKKNVPARYNEILKEIGSDFIFFIDGDCSSERHCLEKLMQQVKKYPDYTGFTGNV